MSTRGGLIALLAAVVLFLPARAGGQQPGAQMRSILVSMLVRQQQFDPAELDAMGPAGMSALLDHLLPDTAEQQPSETPEHDVARLIRRLGDERYRVREEANEALLDMGPAIRPAVRAATASEDAEVSWRATCILRHWDSRKTEDKGRYAPALGSYLTRVKDDERLEEVARRTLLALKDGMPSGGQLAVLQQCIMAVGRSGKDKLTDRLAPLLDHEDVRVAVLVTQLVGAASGNDYFPALMLDALQSQRDEVVLQAISRAPNCWDDKRKLEVERRLIAIFEGDKEPLKFQACFPLMHDYRYAPATDYLLEQVGSTDKSRSVRAIGWLGDASNHGRPASQKLLEVFDPLLKSDDYSQRRAACRAVAIYSGEEVVKRLIPLLGDKKAAIATEVTYRLMHQKDKDMLRRLLAAAAKDDPNETVRKKAAELVKNLDGPDKPRDPFAK